MPSHPLPRRRLALTALVLTLLWGALTGWDPEGWVMGVPAILAGVALAWALPPPAGWRLAPLALLRFVGWFAVHVVIGAVDVSRRAFSADMRLRPGFRRYPLTLPPGAARVVFVNTITLMPGTLSAQIDLGDDGDAPDHVSVHMLDTGADLADALHQHEARIRAAFALPPSEAQP